LQTHYHTASTKGLSSITTLITTPTTNAAILIDPPFLLPDAHSVLAWINRINPHTDLKAIFVTHHHPDHFFSANPILDAYPAAQFHAAPYVLAGIEREYDQKVAYWPQVLGQENVPTAPRKPDPFSFSFVLLEGAPESPIVLLGPLQGDAIDHTVFWLPKERTVVCGDTVYGRSTHVWVEELSTPALLESWRKTLDLIAHLRPEKLIPGHLEAGWELNCQEDLAHTRRYLDVFAEKVTYATVEEKPGVQELYDYFAAEFPQCRENLQFFLGHLANQFGEGGTVWEENRCQGVEAGQRSLGDVCGYLF
ncbi:MBL fold metallo-hydrolase, partial [Aspergillus saccharolyticus JOP 1030-1]